MSGSNTARKRPKEKGLRQLVKVDDALSSTLKRYGLVERFAEYEFILSWREIVGEEIAKRSRPECFQNGSLIVRVCNSTWAQELAFQKHVILHRLRKHLENEAIEDVVFTVGSV